MVDVEKVLAAITEAERVYTPDEPEDEFDIVGPREEELHTLACAKYMTGQNAKCSCTTPAAVRRRCAAERELVEAYLPVAKYDHDGFDFEYVEGRAAGLGLAVRLLARTYGITEEEK